MRHLALSLTSLTTLELLFLDMALAGTRVPRRMFSTLGRYASMSGSHRTMRYARYTVLDNSFALFIVQDDPVVTAISFQFRTLS